MIIPDLVKDWCDENGYTDPFFQEGRYWAFPPNGVMPVQVELYQLARFPEGRTVSIRNPEDYTVSIGGTIITADDVESVFNGLSASEIAERFFRAIRRTGNS